jgi:hypothetical protein
MLFLAGKLGIINPQAAKCHRELSKRMGKAETAPFSVTCKQRLFQQPVKWIYIGSNG